MPNSIMGHGLVGFAASVGGVLGENWSVKVNELGAFMAYLIAEGAGEEHVILNARITTKGKSLLQELKK